MELDIILRILNQRYKSESHQNVVVIQGETLDEITKGVREASRAEPPDPTMFRDWRNGNNLAKGMEKQQEEKQEKNQESVVSQSPMQRVLLRLSVADRSNEILILINTLSTLFRKKQSWRLTEEISV